MNKKIKYLREYYGLHESDISNLIFMNCYKYKRCEAGSMSFSSEEILLLSILFNVPYDYIVLDKYTINDINLRITQVIIPENFNIIQVMRSNLSNIAKINTDKINYSLKEKCVSVSKDRLGKTLNNIRMNKQLESFEVAHIIGICPSVYMQIEQGRYMPDILTLCMLSSLYNCTIDSLLKESPQEI